jgi:hypothetical protein
VETGDVLLCFVDESHQGDFYAFAGVLANEHATKALTDALNRIMLQASVDYGLDPKTEIHAHEMFHGTKEWAGVGARARVNVFEKVVDAVVDADVTILLRGIREKRLRARQAREHYPVQFPPEQVCFQHILQRANAVAVRQDTYALIIADERGDRDRHRERFATYQTRGTPGVYMHTTLNNLLDTVHFAPSHHSRMLQVADVLAFTYRRRTVVGIESDPQSEKVQARIWGKILNSGKVDGAY